MTDQSDIETQGLWVEGAGERFQRESAKLYTVTQDGATYKLYSDEVHEQRLTALRDEADQTLGEAAAVADRVSRSAQAVLDQQTYGDPGDGLTEAQLVKANARRPFVDEDCQKLPHAALTARVKTVLDAGDAANAYLYHRGVQGRLSATDGQGEDRPEALSPTAAAERQELRGLIDELNAVLRGPNAPQKAEAARQALQKARGLRGAINGVARVTHDTDAKTEKALRASGRYSI